MRTLTTRDVLARALHDLDFPDEGGGHDWPCAKAAPYYARADRLLAHSNVAIVVDAVEIVLSEWEDTTAGDAKAMAVVRGMSAEIRRALAAAVSEGESTQQRRVVEREEDRGMSETATMTLTEFLSARFAEDEVVARAAGGEWWHAAQVPGPTMRRSPDEPTETIIDSPRSLITYAVARDEFADHIARHDPARVLAECEAKRRIVELHPGSTDSDECPGCGALLDGTWRTGPGELCPVLTNLAIVYADHPDYGEEWKP